MINRTTLMLPFILLMACADSKSTGKQVKLEGAFIADPEHHIKDQPKIMQGDSTILYTGWYHVVNSGKGLKRELDKSKETYFIDPHPIVTASNFSTFLIDGSNVTGSKHSYRLVMELDDEGADRWSVATKKSIGKQLAFVLDNQLFYVVKVFGQIDNGITVMDRGSDSKEDIENIKTIIESER
ncbi:hypothetical protein [Pedobacter sp. V48]|uniref:SecDF P1 head subdomain-containing protein n=1 Tax=Pedobacter sp. V48 TaxID=509635 RepID=UPI0003E4EE88|nr:hypothetical protein [Pedobacter sp. V48]ETZ22785.1 hypothetical protein N824_21070 [Pedobacter sp. V48]